VGARFDDFAASLGRKFSISAASISGASGEFLSGGVVTGHPAIDVGVKVVIPLLSGVIVPLFREWLRDRKEARELRRAELEEKRKAREAEEKRDREPEK